MGILEALYDIFKFLKHAVKLVIKAAPIWQIGLALIGIVIFVYAGNKWRQTEDNIEEAMSKMLSARLGANKQPYKGLEAFLLSGADPQPENPQLEPEARAAIEGAETDLKAIYGAGFENELAAKLQIVNDGKPAHSQYVMSVETGKFLFAPMIVLRIPPKDQSKGKQAGEVLELLTANHDMSRDMAAAFKMEEVLRAIEQNAKIRQTIGGRTESRRIVQAFFITERGVLVIREFGLKNQRAYYEGKFSEHQFFPESGFYFWPTIEGHEKGGDFDYVSGPYLDLGGNGFVRTFCKRISYPENATAILCVDTQLSSQAEQTINSNVLKLGGDFADMKCDVSDNNQGCDSAKLQQERPDVLSWVNDQVKTAKVKKTTSAVLGGIVLRDQSSNDAMEFTVPVNSALLPDGITTRVNLKWVLLDPAKLQRTSSLQGLFAGLGVLMFIGIFAIHVHDFRLKRVEQKKVLENVAKVMKEAETPFCWLNERNEFIDANNKFISVLGYANFEQLNEVNGKKRTFRELLTPESQLIYDGILQLSKAGHATGSYDIEVISATGKKMKAKAHGEKVPYPEFPLGGTLPHRFGVFLTWDMIQDSQTKSASGTN